MICITIQRTLSVAKVRYLIGDKECFKIFYPRFFAWVNLFSLNHILLYSLLLPFQSIQTYVARVPVFWMVYFVCIFSSFRVFCIKVSRRRRKTVLVPQTNFLRLWHGKKNPWRYALKCFKTILPRTFLCLPCWHFSYSSKEPMSSSCHLYTAHQSDSKQVSSAIIPRLN